MSQHVKLTSMLLVACAKGRQCVLQQGGCPLHAKLQLCFTCFAAPPSIPTDMSLQGGVMRASTAVQQARTRVITTVYLTSEEDMR